MVESEHRIRDTMKCHWFHGLYANIDYASARQLSSEHALTMTNDCQSKKEVVYGWFRDN